MLVLVFFSYTKRAIAVVKLLHVALPSVSFRNWNVHIITSNALCSRGKRLYDTHNLSPYALDSCNRGQW
jgi:hypothetical protein